MELYVFGVWALLMATVWGSAIPFIGVLGTGMRVLFVFPIIVITPVVLVVALEHTRRLIIGARSSTKTTQKKRHQKYTPEDKHAGYLDLLMSSITQARAFSYEEVLGEAHGVRGILTALAVIASFFVHFILMAEMEHQFGLLRNTGLPAFIALAPVGMLLFIVNMTLTAISLGAARGTAHLVEGRRALLARREAIEASQLGGALSMGVAGDGGGELSMSRAGELTDAARASSRDEEVVLDLDEVEEGDVAVVEQARGG
jgi:hypothetical protein